MRFSRTEPLRRLVRDLGLSSEHKKSEIAIVQKHYAELCRIMQDYAFSGRIAKDNGPTVGAADATVDSAGSAVPS